MLKEQLIIDEGLKLKKYKCPAGKWTIGVGRNLDDNPLTEEEKKVVPNTDVITRNQALYLLGNDIAKCRKELSDKIGWFDDAPIFVQEVLINMCFNMGVYGLLKFKLTLKALKEGRYAEAADMMLDSLWARQVGVRANRLAERIKRGI